MTEPGSLIATRRAAPRAPDPSRRASDSAGQRGAARILRLQRTVGNAATSQVLQRGVDAYGVQVEGTDEVSLIHRVEPAQGSAPDTVRCYLTVFARAEKGTTYKDIHAAAPGKVEFINKTDDTMLNVGDPRRAYHYIRTYMSQDKPASIPIIRSFDIPRKLYDEITGGAISESQRAKLGKDKAYNVDKERGQNQFGLPPGDRDRIEAAGSNLISYVSPQHIAKVAADPSNGTVKDIDSLLSEQLGMPDAEHRKYLPQMKGAHVQAPKQEAEHGANLTRFYDDLDALIRAKTGGGGNPLHIYEFQIKAGFSTISSNYYGPVVAALAKAEGYLPGRPVAELQKLRDEVGKAATFSVIPQMVTEEYLQANAKLHGQARDKNDEPLSDWTSAQNFTVKEKPSIRPVEAPKKAKPTAQEIKEMKEQAEQERKAKAAQAATEPEENLDLPF